MPLNFGEVWNIYKLRNFSTFMQVLRERFAIFVPFWFFRRGSTTHSNLQFMFSLKEIINFNQILIQRIKGYFVFFEIWPVKEHASEHSCTVQNFCFMTHPLRSLATFFFLEGHRSPAPGTADLPPSTPWPIPSPPHDPPPPYPMTYPPPPIEFYRGYRGCATVF